MRILVGWCPDWSVVAGLADEQRSQQTPAVTLAGTVVAVCNAAARHEGIRRGMRRRDAQARCPELRLLTENPQRDARAFEAVLQVVEDLSPGVMPIRPGLLALRAPDRIYGGEAHAAAVLAQGVVESGVWDVRLGVADDLFTAEQAARTAAVQEHVIVPPAGSAQFLTGLPIEALLTDDHPDAPDLVSLLRRLGLRTLGNVAELPGPEVGQRFGDYGARVWRRVSGADPRGLVPREPPPELTSQVAFDPPLESVEAICFSVRTATERFVDDLAARHLVATQVRIEALCESSGAEPASSRSWLHPRHFSARDLVDRVHWQLHGMQRGSLRSGRDAGEVDSPVTAVRFILEVLESVSAHAETLWGGGADELVERGLARVQAMLGPGGVLVPVLQGGRSPTARQAFVPWGERATALRPLDQPWPGPLPGPPPAQVFTEPPSCELHDHSGRPVAMTERGQVTGEPARVRLPDDGWLPVTSWAGPWPADEGWWERPDHAAKTPAARFQIVTADGRAWLMSCADSWSLEAAYD